MDRKLERTMAVAGAAILLSVPVAATAGGAAAHPASAHLGKVTLKHIKRDCTRKHTESFTATITANKLHKGTKYILYAFPPIIASGSIDEWTSPAFRAKSTTVHNLKEKIKGAFPNTQTTAPLNKRDKMGLELETTKYVDVAEGTAYLAKC